AEFVGITASDILNYNLPTDALTPRDIGALNAEMTDPRFNDEFWRTEIQAMLQINKKAEQQALAKYGLDYVTDTYLPEQIGPLGFMLARPPSARDPSARRCVRPRCLRRRERGER